LLYIPYRAQLFDLNKPYKRLNVAFHGGNLLKTILKVRDRGKRGHDISSVPIKRLEKMKNYKKKRWEYKDGCLILEAF